MISVARSDVEVASSISFKPFTLMGVETTAQFVQKSKTFASSTTTTTSTVQGGGTAMQKSKSSSSVMHHGSRLMAKKIFRSRSKSQTRPAQATCSWTPQGSCIWSNNAGRQVVLADSTLLQLSEIERTVLQKVALAKLQALNLGVAIRLPPENVGAVVSKPKRRPYLLKRKALTTSIFDTNRKDNEKESTTSGLVFGIPLTQCVENDRLTRTAARTSPFRSRAELSGTPDEPAAPIGRHGSRSSFSSLIEPTRGDESGSCESLMYKNRFVGSVPGLLDSLSCGSTTDLPGAAAEEEAAVPNILNACFKHIEQHGLRTLGIFRVSTSKKRIRQLREDFDCGKETTLDNEQCPHDVATLLKEYLRDLPDPLLCRHLYQAFVQTQRIRNRRRQFEALQYLVQLLPAANRDTLYALLTFLAIVAHNADDKIDESSGECVSGNKMDSNNLATVFAPNILHCIKPGAKDTPNRPEDRIDVINVVRTLIDNYKQLFIVSAELLDEIYVHMMESHPEILDQLLNKRDAVAAAADESVEELDSESYSAPWTDTIQTSESEPKKTYSREECLHEAAATGGPNVGMRIRHKDRIRERMSRRRRDDSVSRKKREDETAGSGSGGGIGAGITSAIMSRLRGQKDDDYNYGKNRSSSLESTSSTHTDSDLNRVLRLTDDDRRKSSPYVLDSGGVITASLTIPVQTGASQPFPLNLDDDIPYIEDVENGRQQLTIGLVRTPTAPPRRRQRSISGSDSSVTSQIQPITGSISLIQSSGGYDSAVGSSVTYSSPVATSSSLADQSSPPSWASTPPTSPDSTHTTVNYIPDDGHVPKVTPRLHQKSQPSSPMLQKVSFSSTQEVQQVSKSFSTTSFEQIRNQEREQRFTPSITSIGNAVLRSKTADFERITKVDQKTSKSSAVLMSSTATAATAVATSTSQSSSSISEKKKYTKRRYTESRHQTRHIPDSETLDATSAQSKKDDTTAAAQTGPVYKRRELISSVPSK